MLTFFPDPYEDELLYGLLSRYHYYSGNIELKDTIRELFDKSSVIPSFEFGYNLKNLSNKLGKYFTSENLVMKHTLIPYYMPFMTKEKREDIIEQITKGNGNGVYNKIGIAAGSICRKRGIFYCPKCIKEDVENYGESYIHRTHQLQGVLVCYKHGLKLKEYCKDKSDVSRLEFLKIDHRYVDMSEECYTGKVSGNLKKIAEGANYILNYDLQIYTKDNVSRLYHELIESQGFKSACGNVNQDKLHDAFVRYYGYELLQLLESSIDKDNEYNWLRVITRKSDRVVHPLRHILMINFLVEGMEEFFKCKKIYYGPFGCGPWPCLNPASDHYRKKMVHECKITSDYKTRVPVGTFKCSCGFVYSRKGPDKEENDLYKIGRIKEYGNVWEEELRKLLIDKNNSMREIGRKLRCDCKTVKKYDEKLGVNRFSYPKSVKENTEQEVENKQIDIEMYKKIVLDILENNENLSRTHIRNLIKREYAYLYRHDREWLFDHLPDRKKKLEVASRVDWCKRDEDIVEDLKRTYKELMHKEKSVRITRSILAKRCMASSLIEKKIDKLPKTKNYLDLVCESIENFQLRRVRDIICTAEKEDISLKTWEINRKAGLSKNCSYNVKKRIDEYVNRRSDYRN